MAEDNYVEDGTYDFSLGVDSWHKPDRIRDNQIAGGVNLTTRRGTLGPRPGFRKLKLLFDETVLRTSIFGYQRTARDIWTTGKMQALIPYSTLEDDYVITIVSGYIFKTNLRTLRTRVLSTTVRVNQYAPRINWSFANAQIVVFDYPAYPLIISGDNVVRASPTHLVDGVNQPQVPITNLGTYNSLRLFVANAGVEFTASDAVGNKATPEAPITFAEVFTPSSAFVNQVFSLPVEDAFYPISAMGFIQALDSSTGIGQMFVATKKKLYTYQVNQPRANWGNMIDFGSVLLANAGISGPRAVVNVNSDLIFMSGEGQLHALSSGRNDAKKWSNVPISREVQRYLRFTDLDLAQYCAIGYFNNRIFVTANPYRTAALDLDQQKVTDYAHGGFVILELEELASFLTEGTPIWGGLWTGINPTDICNVNKRCIVTSKDSGDNINSGNALYELLESAKADTIDDRTRQIRSIIETREYNCKSAFGQKRESTVALHLQDLEGEVKLKIERKPSHSNRWLELTVWEHDTIVEDCNIPIDDLINGVDQLQLKQLIFGDGATDPGCNPVSQDEYITYRAIQYRLTIEGKSWSLDGFKIRAEAVQFLERQDPEMCAKLPDIKLPSQCDPDWLIPLETLCNG